MQNLTFYKNQNNKLDCNCFTLIVPKAPLSYHEGAIFMIQLKQEGTFITKGICTIHSVNETTLNSLSENDYMLDLGLTKEKALKLWTSYYKNKPSDFIDYEVFYKVLFKKIDKPIDEPITLKSTKPIRYEQCPTCDTPWVDWKQILSQTCHVCGYPTAKINTY